MGDFVGAAVGAAQADMAKVLAAASAIQAQYNSTRPLMTAQTAAGGRADQDMGDWNALCNQVLSLLGGLAGATQTIVADTRAQAEAALKKDPGLARVS
jgi:hypothetical protein